METDIKQAGKTTCEMVCHVVSSHLKQVIQIICTTLNFLNSE